MSHSLDDIFSPAAKSGEPFFERYGLLQNPFPPSRAHIPSVLYKQDEAWKRFYSLVSEIMSSSTPTRRTMALSGGTGYGKTHFLRHSIFKFEEATERYKRPYISVEFHAGTGTIIDLIRHVYEAANKTCIQFYQDDFIDSLIRKLSNESISQIQQTDLHNALKHLSRAASEKFSPTDRNQYYTYEVLRDIFVRWLTGGALNTTERKYLGAYTRISTSSLAIRVMSELFTLARKLNVIEGMLLCLDEIETLFSSGIKPAKYQAFLQDLRYFLDESIKEDSGYTLLVITASTPLGFKMLLEFNYPLFTRLGFSDRINLTPIKGVEEAIEFAHTYIRHDHDKWNSLNAGKTPQLSPLSLLTDFEIADAFKKAVSANPQTRVAPTEVNQAPLLDALHLQVEDKKMSLNL